MYKLVKLTWNPLDSVREDIIHSQYALDLGFHIELKKEHSEGIPAGGLTFVYQTPTYDIRIWETHKGWKCADLINDELCNNRLYKHLAQALSDESTIINFFS